MPVCLLAGQSSNRPTCAACRIRAAQTGFQMRRLIKSKIIARLNGSVCLFVCLTIAKAARTFSALASKRALMRCKFKWSSQKRSQDHGGGNKWASLEPSLAYLAHRFKLLPSRLPEIRTINLIKLLSSWRRAYWVSVRILVALAAAAACAIRFGRRKKADARRDWTRKVARYQFAGFHFKQFMSFVVW